MPSAKKKDKDHRDIFLERMIIGMGNGSRIVKTRKVSRALIFEEIMMTDLWRGGNEYLEKTKERICDKSGFCLGGRLTFSRPLWLKGRI